MSQENNEFESGSDDADVLIRLEEERRLEGERIQEEERRLEEERIVEENRRLHDELSASQERLVADEQQQSHNEQHLQNIFSDFDNSEFSDIDSEADTSTKVNKEELDEKFNNFINGAGDKDMKNNSIETSNQNNDQVPVSAYEEIDVGDDSRYIDEQFNMGSGFINDEGGLFNASEAYKEYQQRMPDEGVAGDMGSFDLGDINSTPSEPVQENVDNNSKKISGKLIDPSEKNSIEERLSGYVVISDVELASILDEEIGNEKTEKFFSTVDKYLKENPEKSSAIPIDFVLKRLDYLSGKFFSNAKSTKFEGLGEKSLNLSNDSPLSQKPQEKVVEGTISKTKNESQMTKGEVEASRKTQEQSSEAERGKGSLLSLSIGRKPSVKSVVGADSVMNPSDSFNSGYSSEARTKYTEALNSDMKRFYDLSSSVEKNNTPKNRRELSRAITSMNQSLDKGMELLSDPSSFKDKGFFKELYGNARAVNKKLGDLKKAKIIGDDDVSFKELMDKIGKIITKTLSLVAGKLGVKTGHEKGSDSDLGM